jgi:hypothetical protein
LLAPHCCIGAAGAKASEAEALAGERCRPTSPEMRLLLILLLSGSALAAPAAEPGWHRPGAAALEAARQFLCPHGGSPGRVGGRCRGGGDAASAVRGWDRDLPPANHGQVPCPVGTRPEAAIAATAVRCIP